MKFRKKIISVILSAALLTTAVFSVSAVTVNEELSKADTSTAVSSVDYELADNVQEGVILHCWNWSYNNIKKYLPQIAAAGYTAIQTSPVTQPKDYYWEGVAYGNVGIPDGTGGYDSNWWKVYQPVTESICDNGHTWFGTKAEFKSMCDEAEKYGIKVIVDIVANHMGNIEGWKIGSVEAVMGDISHQVGEFWNPEMLTDSTYWHISTTWTHSSDGRFDVTQGNMGMPDLNTGDKRVQNMILNLLKECIDNGADGFRFDAAKHIETPDDNSAFASDFWNVVLDGATAYAKSTKNFTPYYYGEVLNRIDDTAAENYYLSKMSLTDNSTSDNIRNTLKYGGIGGASNSGYCGYVHGQGNKVVLWAESHDTYMGGGSSYDCNDSTINKAWAIVASRKDSTGLYFARPYYSYERLIDDQNGYEARKDPATMAKSIRQTQLGEVGTFTWMDPCVAEVNRFRNHYIGKSESLGSSDDKLFYNVRGNDGVVLVSSTGPCDVSLNLQGKMKDGTYTDQVTGKTFTVSGGTIKGTIENADGIAVVYNNTTVPRNTIEAPRENFAYSSIDVQVGLNNASSGTYSINGSTPVTYTDTATFTLGNGDAVGTEYKVTLTATNGSDTTSETFYFTKEGDLVNPTDPSNPPTEPVTTVPSTTSSTDPTGETTPTSTSPTGSTVVYFDNSSYNWSEVYAYVYADGSGNNAAWPGEKMQYDSSTGYYFYEVPDKFVNGRVLFTESKTASTNRYPAEGQPGMEIGGTSKLFSANHTWSNYTAPTQPSTAVTEPSTVVTEPSTAVTEPSTSVTTPVYQLGDVNMDGYLDIRDATAIQLYIAEVDMNINTSLADFDGSGEIDIRDATEIQIKIAEIG